MSSTTKGKGHLWTPSSHPSASVALDVLRGIASLYVVCYHLRELFFTQLEPSVKALPLQKFFNSAFNYGHFAVIVFFVISGLVIAASVLRRQALGTWSFGGYLFDRLTRLWIVLIPALVLTLLWDRLGMTLFGTHGVYAGLPEDGGALGYAVAPRLAPKAFLCNLFFLQTIFSTTYGSNGPLWSLAFEFWYYILFPVLLTIITVRKPISILLHLGILVAILALVGKSIAFLFPIWLMGAFLVPLLARYILPQRTQLALCVVTWGAFVVTATNTNWMHGQQHLDVLRDLVVGGVATLAVWALCTTREPSDSERKSSGPCCVFFTKLGRMSYTLYVVHMPLLAFIHAGIYNVSREKWPLDVTHAIFASGILITCVLYAYLVSLLTETHTESARRLLRQVLHFPRKAAEGVR